MFPKGPTSAGVVKVYKSVQTVALRIAIETVKNYATYNSFVLSSLCDFTSIFNYL